MTEPVLPDIDLDEIDPNPIEIFAATYFSHLMTADVPEPHRAIYEGLHKLVTDQIQPARLVIKGFRGLAKSAIACRIYPAYLICETKTPEVQMFSASGGAAGLSTKWMDLLKKELDTNVVLKYDYGFKRGEHWGQDHIQVVRADGSAVDFYSRGKGATCRGARGDVIIDDPQSLKDVDSEAILATDDTWLFSEVIPILLKDQRLCFIGNPLSPLSLIQKASKIQGWTVLEFPAEDPVGSGKSVWPEQFPDDFLALRLNEIGRDRYNAEYLLRPMVSGNPVFREEWFKYYEPDSAAHQRVLQDQLYTVIGFDGADSVNTAADATAIVTLSAGPGTDPDIYVREVHNLHLTIKDAVSTLFGVKERMDANLVVVESRVKEGNLGPYEVEIRDRERVERASLGARIVRPDKDKVRRAEYVQGLVQRGKIHFDAQDKNHVELMTQLMMFTGDGKFHDDLVDAFVYAATEIKDRSKRLSDSQQAQRTLPRSIHINPRTGVVV